VKLPQTYRFQLSDREFASAFVREYYRRPGARVMRVLSGPGLVVLGTIMLMRSGELFMRGVSIVAVLLGAWLVAKPFLMAWSMTSRRRRMNRAATEIEVRFGREGMRVTDGSAKTELPWSKLAAAGLSDDYVWLELATGTRATIPRRAIEDLDALRELLRARVAWKS